jgi:hypothetical protein
MSNEQTRRELQRTLKPLIKQCVKDVLLEEGILAKIVSEVVQGVQPLYERKQRPVKESKENKQAKLAREQMAQERWKKETERKRKLLDATGFKGVDVFEGTKPLTESGSPESGPAPKGALAGVAPNDPGVDISGIMNLSNNRWKDLI